MNIELQDGVYQVTRSYFCAGFVVRDGFIILVAPILRKKLSFWITQAVRVGSEKNEDVPQYPVIP
jgi:hypothetical protein